MYKFTKIKLETARKYYRKDKQSFFLLCVTGLLLLQKYSISKSRAFLAINFSCFFVFTNLKNMFSTVHEAPKVVLLHPCTKHVLRRMVMTSSLAVD